jgi:urease accessory protein
MTVALGAERAASRANETALTANETASPAAGHWDASLELAFARQNGRTALVGNRHSGPLVVQKALYPDGDANCETVILHPPGGIAGGDRLSIAIDAGPGSSVLLTTPGATRWYKANGRQASQRVRIAADDASIVEWMPMETIVFDRAEALSALEIDLHGDARAAGWEVVAFGRGAAGERFENGRFRQRIEVRRDGRLRWAEYGDIRGGDPLFDSPIGLAGNAVSGMLWVACNADGDWSAGNVDANPTGLTGVTRLPDGIMLARCLGASTEQVKAWLQRIWACWRPRYAGREARPPRLWAT